MKLSIVLMLSSILLMPHKSNTCISQSPSIYDDNENNDRGSVQVRRWTGQMCYEYKD